jgi:pimeloyl-ACP methyl ester carboxylesterase
MRALRIAVRFAAAASSSTCPVGGTGHAERLPLLALNLERGGIGRTLISVRADWKAIEIPTLVLHGDPNISAPFPPTGPKTAASIRGSKLVVYENALHALLLATATG